MSVDDQWRRRRRKGKRLCIVVAGEFDVLRCFEGIEKRWGEGFTLGQDQVAADQGALIQEVEKNPLGL